MSDLVTISNQLTLDQHPVATYLASLTSPGSRRTMKQSLNLIAGLVSNGECDAMTFTWHNLRYQHTAAIRSALAQRCAPNTCNKHLAAMKGVLHQCRRLGLMSAQDREAAADIKPIKSQRLPKGRSLASSEIEDLKRAILLDHTPSGVRDAAILAILRVGLRRAEIVGLDLKDFDNSENSLTIRGGKGRKDRIVYVPEGASSLIVNWVSVRGNQPGALIFAISKTSNLIPRRLSAQAIATIMQARGTSAGLENFSPHDFRRTFVGDLLDAGVDIVTVQSLAGHANPATTARYDRRGDKAKKKAASALNF